MLLIPLIRELLKCRMLWLVPLICLCIAVHGQTHANTYRITQSMDLTQMDYTAAKAMAIK